MNKKTNELFTSQLVTWKKMLTAKPIKNQAAVFQKHDEKHIKATVKKKKPKYLIPPLSWIIRPKLHQDIILDEIGSGILNLCDGIRTVEDIIEDFSQQHKLTFHEARASITGYMKLLVQRGILAIAAQE